MSSIAIRFGSVELLAFMVLVLDVFLERTVVPVNVVL